MDLGKDFESPDSVWTRRAEKPSPALMVANIIALGLGFLVVTYATIQTFGPVGKFVGGGATAGLIIVGGLLVVVGILGTEATRNRSVMKCALYYVVILTFVCLGSVVLGVAVLNEGGLGERLSQAWNRMEQETVQEVEVHFACCGFRNLNDRPTLPCPANARSGCKEPLMADLQSRLATMGHITFALAGVEFVGLILTAIVLARHLSYARSLVQKAGEVGWDAVPSHAQKKDARAEYSLDDDRRKLIN